MQKADYPVRVNCPVTSRIETVYFILCPDGGYIFNGCDNASGDDACVRCRQVETPKFKSAHHDLVVH